MLWLRNALRIHNIPYIQISPIYNIPLFIPQIAVLYIPIFDQKHILDIVLVYLPGGFRALFGKDVLGTEDIVGVEIEETFDGKFFGVEDGSDGFIALSMDMVKHAGKELAV